MADLGLADAVDATETLLDPVGIPEPVAVDHRLRALPVDARACVDRSASNNPTRSSFAVLQERKTASFDGRRRLCATLLRGHKACSSSCA
jgi:hypothetical protein